MSPAPRHAVRGWLVPVVLSAVLVACGSDGAPGGDPGAAGPPDGAASGSITVVGAASLTDVLTDIGAAFEAAHAGASVELAFGPSSALVTQVGEGAPADVVATASTATMAELVEADALDGDPVPFATNVLEVAVPAGNPGGVEGLDDLADDDLVVALCAPEVPCGALAREALARAGVVPAVDSEEADARALLAKVEADEVDAGVVYRTDVLAAGDGVDGLALPEAAEVVATYPIALPEQVGDRGTARAFVDFVLSDAGQAVLARAGFGPP